MTDRFETEVATYIVIKPLRERLAASTYLVRRESDGHELILKELRIGKLKDWKAFDLFEREVAALKSIEHPRIPRWVDSHLDETQGRFVLVQTQVVGKTLRELCSEHRSLSAEQTEDYLRQCLAVLDFLHARSPPVIHRDLTPSNIMVSDGEVHLIDFGAVKIGREESTSLTTVGTFGYMAPEQLLGRVDVRSDLYGLGMSFIMLSTGLEPPELPQDPDTGQIDPWSVLTVPIPLGRTLLKMIRPGLNERLPSARAALAMLDEPETSAAPVAAPPAVRVEVDRSVSLSPYAAPEMLSERDKEFMSKHSLRAFPVWAAVLLHYATFGLASLIRYSLAHDRFPKAVAGDPSAGKALGFSFIPYFNLYWCVYSPLRLADRINLQNRIRGRGDGVPRGLVLFCGVLGVIPYLNVLLGVPMWGIGVAKLQKAINQLAAEREAEKAAELAEAQAALALKEASEPDPA